MVTSLLGFKARVNALACSFVTYMQWIFFRFTFRVTPVDLLADPLLPTSFFKQCDNVLSLSEFQSQILSGIYTIPCTSVVHLVRSLCRRDVQKHEHQQQREDHPVNTHHCFDTQLVLMLLSASDRHLNLFPSKILCKGVNYF